MTIKLYYFDFPGRGESIRLILTLGDVEFEDFRIAREAWPEMKQRMPFGQVPAIDVDGVWIAQSRAIERYAASLGGLLPQDPLEAAKAEQVLFVSDDAYQLFGPTFKMDTEAKVAARQELLKGDFGAKLKLISKQLEGKKFVLGDELCYVDLVMFSMMSTFKSGFIEGIPPTFMDDFPALKAFHHSVASLDKVKAYYADKIGGLYSAFKVDA